MTQKKLKEILGKILDAPEYHLEMHGNKVAGSVVSDTFVGIDDFTRQQMVFKALGDYGVDISWMLAYTYDEWNVELAYDLIEK